MKAPLTMAMASLLLLAACGAQPGAGTGGQVGATLTDTAVTLDQTSVAGGPVTFKVKNVGTVEHELVVIKTNLAQDKIQPDKDEPGKMSEEGSLGESGDLAIGESKEFTLNLTPGKYVLMCNQPGHYLIGMHVAFTVR